MDIPARVGLLVGACNGRGSWMAVFPSMKARELRRLLKRAPLLYDKEVPGKGSHMGLISAAGYPKLTWAFHDGQTLPPGLVRKILTKDVGLSEDDARALL